MHSLNQVKVEYNNLTKWRWFEYDLKYILKSPTLITDVTQHYTLCPPTLHVSLSTINVGWIVFLYVIFKHSDGVRIEMQPFAILLFNFVDWYTITTYLIVILEWNFNVLLYIKKYANILLQPRPTRGLSAGENTYPPPPSGSRNDQHMYE